MFWSDTWIGFFRWWKEAQDSNLADGNAKRGVLYSATPGSSYVGPMKIINNIFNSDLVFNLRREEDSGHSNENGEVGVSGRDYALVPGDLWLQALKWWVCLDCALSSFVELNYLNLIGNWKNTYGVCTINWEFCFKKALKWCMCSMSLVLDAFNSQRHWCFLL